MAMMTAAEAAEAGKNLNFEKVWAALMETRENIDRISTKIDQLAEQSKETDARIEKRSRETDAQIEKRSKELDKQFEEMRERSKKTDAQIEKTSREVDKLTEQIEKTSREVDRLSKNVGGLNRSMGELIETLIAARLWEKFRNYPYNLQRAYQRIPLYDEHNRVLTDIDILLADTEWVMAVEVKRELSEKAVDQHVKRMARIRQYPPAEAKGKKLLGALAGGVVNPDIRDYAYQAGFFVLELTGESVGLIQPPAGFKPQEW